jgi:hypothetical protein
VVGDSVYGAASRLRRLIERHGRGYVLTVTSAQHLGFKPVADWLEDVLANAGWQRLSAGDGAKGPRLYDWAYLPHHAAEVAPGWQKGLLIPGSRVEGIPGQDRDRRKINKPEEFTFYLTLAPVATTLAELVRVAGTRWVPGLDPGIESCFEAAKGEVGLDEYEVRSWTGWHRHITLAMLAHAYLAVLRKTAGGEKIGAGRQHRSRLTAGPGLRRGRLCCPTPCRNCAGCCGGWSGRIRPTPNMLSPGRCGDADTSSAPAAPIGNGEHTPMKPGYSTRPAPRR